MSMVTVRNVSKQTISVIVKRKLEYMKGGTRLTIGPTGVTTTRKTEAGNAPSQSMTLEPKQAVQLERSEVTQDILRKVDKGLLQIEES